ncbi:MAG: type I restriction endonuclease subunit M [Rhodocyclales bacterium]|nr:type I restriction endonuclease subunit M [Rhodocyclales bacterium]
MTAASLRNHKGFFSDYWLGTVLAARGGAGPRLSAAQVKKALDRVTRGVDAMAGANAPDLTRFRERFARPLLDDWLGYEMHEHAAEPRLRPLSLKGDAGAPIAAVLLCPDASELEGPKARRLLEDGLLALGLDHGFLLSPEALRLIRKPGLGSRGAAFDLGLASVVELQDGDSLAAAYRVLCAANFAPGGDGRRPIDALEEESRRHSAKVSNDLKQAVFEAAERIVGGFLDDVRTRPEAFAQAPSLDDLRDAGFLALYRLLFILYAEARDERLIRHALYQKSYSLDGIVTRLLRTPPQALAANRCGLWQQLLALFRIFNEGIAPNLPDLENIPPRGGRLFSETTPEGALLRRLRLNDRATAAILLALATARPRRGVGRERVSFRELEIEQLGHIYEGLLEYEPAEAAEAMVEVSVAGRELALTPADVVRLCEQKQLHVRGDAALLAGTAAAHLHPDLAPEDEDDPIDGEADDAGADDEADENDEGEGEGEAAIARGAALKLLRRIEPGEFFFKPGSARKASGSYYTPTAMVDDLARHALGPLVAGRDAAGIERLRVIDIACGSGHFLVGAARFLAPALLAAYRRERGGGPPAEFHPDRALSAEVRTRWEAEGPDWCRRRVIERCLFGVDLNPAAVQLAQVALWIESLAGERPLSFFAHHIRCGNSLLGGSLARVDAPPDPKLGKPRDRHTRGLFETELRRRLDEAFAERRLIDQPLPPEVRRDTTAEYAYKDDRLRRAEAALAQARLLLDLRSASPFLPGIWADLPALMSSFDLEADARSRPWWTSFEAVRRQERFFHWELEFPEVFLDREHPGFDAVLGNPPWDKVLPSKLEFYGRYDALIRSCKGNELDRRIRELHAEHHGLAGEFAAYQERAKTIARVLRGGGDFPLAEARSQAAHEDLAKYFVDRALGHVAPGGAVGLVVPSVLYNGDGWVGIRRHLLEDVAVERFYGFENREKIFPIDSRYKFLNLVARRDAAHAGAFSAAFMRRDVAELEQAGSKPWEVRITREDISRYSPETLAFLEFRSSRDQEIVRKMYAGKPTLREDGPGAWDARLISWRAHETVFNSAEDKDLFTDSKAGKLWTPKAVLGIEPVDDGEAINLMRDNGFWPVFEGKHVDQFLVGVKPVRWWLSVEQAERKYKRPPLESPTLVFRDIASNTNERTCIAGVLPEHSAGADTLTGMIVKGVVSLDAAATVLNSLCFDYALRMRTAGTHVSFTYILPMPVPPAEVVARLPALPTRLAWDTRLGHVTEDRALWPQLWAANRAVAEAYGLTPDDFAHILGTFPGMARKRPEFVAFLHDRLAEWKSG